MDKKWEGTCYVVEHNGDKVVVDIAKLPQVVIDGAVRLGIKTALRNATAGKADDEDVAFLAMKAKAEVFNSGVWEKATESKAKVELTDAERKAEIIRHIVETKVAGGDARDPKDIAAAFIALDDARKTQIMAALQKGIDKRLATALRNKKAAVKGPKVDF